MKVILLIQKNIHKNVCVISLVLFCVILFAPINGQVEEEEYVELFFFPYGQAKAQYLSVSSNGDVCAVYGIPAQEGSVFGKNSFLEVYEERYWKIANKERLHELFNLANESLQCEYIQDDVAYGVGKFYFKYRNSEKWWFYEVRAPEVLMTLVNAVDEYTLFQWAVVDESIAKERESRLHGAKMAVFFSPQGVGDAYEYILTSANQLIVSYGWLSNNSFVTNDASSFFRLVKKQEVIVLTEEEACKLIQWCQDAIHAKIPLPEWGIIADTPTVILLCNDEMTQWRWEPYWADYAKIGWPAEVERIVQELMEKTSLN